MKLLWLTNKIIPQVDQAQGNNSKLVNEGWLSQMFMQLCAADDVDMTIVCCGAAEDLDGKGENFKWYTVCEGQFEENNYSKEQEQTFYKILMQESPDVIHIWGTEYPHSLAFVNAAIACGYIDKTLISMQGLVSIYAMYYYQCAMPEYEFNRKTLVERIRKTSMHDTRQMFQRRGQYEIEALSKVRHCIGRTEWDYHCVKAFNRNINYHFCNETLRECFYSDGWEYDRCEKHSIFVSQATYPLKGFHQLLNALPKLIDTYPDVHVYVSGADQTANRTLKEKLKLSSYGKYLKSLIKKYHLQSHITFVGKQNANQMKQLYLRANVFVSCASIENSPNSVGEAMLLGTPVVASDVGGTSTILRAPDEGVLYRWDDTNALAEAIAKVFNNPEAAMDRACKARQHALETHDADKNFHDLLNIYAEIQSCSKM